MGFNPNGLNASLSTTGVNLGTVTNNGYQAGEQNWAQENISAAQNNAGEIGDRWLEGVIEDPGTFFRENIPIAGGVLGSVADMVSSTLIAGSALLPPYNISVSLSPNGELKFGFPNVASIEKGAGLFKMGTEIGTMPVRMMLNPGAITPQGFPLPGFGDIWKWDSIITKIS